MSRYEFELRFDDSYWPSLCTMCSFTWWLFVQPRLSYMPLQSFASLLCLFSLLLIIFFLHLLTPNPGESSLSVGLIPPPRVSSAV